MRGIMPTSAGRAPGAEGGPRRGHAGVASAYTSGMKKSLRIPLILLFVGVVLAGCGNKGDLVLPDPPEPTTAETQPEP